MYKITILTITVFFLGYKKLQFNEDIKKTLLVNHFSIFGYLSKVLC